MAQIDAYPGTLKDKSVLITGHFKQFKSHKNFKNVLFRCGAAHVDDKNAKREMDYCVKGSGKFYKSNVEAFTRLNPNGQVMGIDRFLEHLQKLHLEATVDFSQQVGFLLNDSLERNEVVLGVAERNVFLSTIKGVLYDLLTAKASMSSSARLRANKDINAPSTSGIRRQQPYSDRSESEEEGDQQEDAALTS